MYQEYDVNVVGVGPDPEGARRIATLFESPFPILADPDRQVYRAYGLTRAALVIQRSGTALIDRTGILRYLHRVRNPQRSFRKEDVWAAIEHLRPS